MHRRAALLAIVGLSLFAPRVALAAPPPPSGQTFSIRSADVPPARGTIPPPIKPSIASDPGTLAAAITPPRYDLLWSPVLDRALAERRGRRDRHSDMLSSILQPAPVDVLIPPHPEPWIPSGTPPPVPTALDKGLVTAQPVAIISPVPLGAEIQGQLQVTPSLVLRMPWMIP